MLQVSGFVGISREVKVEEVSGEKGSFFNFAVVSQDPDSGTKTRYNSSMWVPNSELAEWREALKGGNVFFLKLGHWAMQQNEGWKYPIPKLKIDRFNFKKMSVAYWWPKQTK